MTPQSNTNLKRTDLWFGKWHDECSKFSPEQTKASKFGLLSGRFIQQKMYELKTCRGVMRYDNEERCKVWKGIDSSVQNQHEEFNKFWQEHSKI